MLRRMQAAVNAGRVPGAELIDGIPHPAGRRPDAHPGLPHRHAWPSSCSCHPSGPPCGGCCAGTSYAGSRSCRPRRGPDRAPLPAALAPGPHRPRRPGALQRAPRREHGLRHHPVGLPLAAAAAPRRHRRPRVLLRRLLEGPGRRGHQPARARRHLRLGRPHQRGDPHRREQPPERRPPSAWSACCGPGSGSSTPSSTPGTPPGRCRAGACATRPWAWAGSLGAGLLFAGSFVLSAAAQLLPWYLAPLGILAGLATGVVLWLWTAHTLPNRQVGLAGAAPRRPWWGRPASSS